MAMKSKGPMKSGPRRNGKGGAKSFLLPAVVLVGAQAVLRRDRKADLLQSRLYAELAVHCVRAGQQLAERLAP